MFIAQRFKKRNAFLEISQLEIVYGLWKNCRLRRWKQISVSDQGRIPFVLGCPWFWASLTTYCFWVLRSCRLSGTRTIPAVSAAWCAPRPWMGCLSLWTKTATSTAWQTTTSETQDIYNNVSWLWILFRITQDLAQFKKTSHFICFFFFVQLVGNSKADRPRGTREIDFA